jgi:signal transduction histidine kinase
VQHWLVHKFPIPTSQGSAPLLGGAAFNVTELKRSEAALRQALEEREDLARDLHDGIVQDIYAIGLGLDEIRRSVAQDAPSAAGGLAQAIGGLNEVIGKVRGHILGAAPQVIDGHQLRAELQQLARMADCAQRLRFRLDIDQHAVSLLTSDAAIQVLHIVREAMSNSLRHSFGRSGRVSLRVHKHGVRVVVEDDGDGFERQDARGDGQGLQNMAARASQLNARLDIQSSPGAGTRITLDIPERLR